jgi:hypothetical protein
LGSEDNGDSEDNHNNNGAKGQEEVVSNFEDLNFVEQQVIINLKSEDSE